MPAEMSSAFFWAGAIARAWASKDANGPSSSAGLGFRLPVAAVRPDVPDRPDVLRLPDADLDVCFFTDPAPSPDAPGRRSRDKYAAGGLDRRRGLVGQRVDVVEYGAIQSSVLADVPGDLRAGGY